MLYYLKKKNNGSILIVLHNNKSNKQTQTHIISQKHHRDPETHLPQVCRKNTDPETKNAKKQERNGRWKIREFDYKMGRRVLPDYIYKGVSEETEEENKCE